MKNLVIIILFVLTVPTFSQFIATIEIETQVTVIDPIKLTKSVDLNFGIIVSDYN